MAKLTSITGKVLLQIGDMEPVEVGTVEIPINASIVPEPAKRYHSTTNGDDK